MVMMENNLILGSDRWLSFMENAAEGLQLSLTLFSPTGIISPITVPKRCFVCNGENPIITNNDIATANYSIENGRTEFLTETGLYALALPLENDLWLVACGCSHCSKHSPISIKEKAIKAQILLSKFQTTLLEGIEGGNRALELSTLRQMNHILLNFFQGGSKGKEYAFNLVLSAIVILLDAKGSWLEYEEVDTPTILIQGDKQLVESYKSKLHRDNNLGVFVNVQNGSIHGFIGVLEPRDFKRAKSLLPLLAEECAIVFEIQKLFELVKTQMTRVLGSINSGVLLVNKYGNINYINKACARLLGNSEIHCLGSPALNMSTPWTPYYLLREDIEGSMDCLDISGEKYYVDWQMNTLYDGKEFAGWIVLVADKTEYYNLQMVSRKVERFSTTAVMVGSLAHELRNPISAAKGLVQLIGSKQEINKIRSYSNLILKELDRVTALLNEFLLLGKPAEISLESLYLKDFMGELVPLLEGEGFSNNVNIIFELNEVRPINVDSGQLTQVVLNLVRNAIEATGEDGSVKIILEDGDKEAFISVLDNGPGLPVGKEDMLFEPFFSTKQRGTGLGLSIVQAIVNNHGGRITAENNPSGGAIFKVSLPYALFSLDTKIIDVLLVIPNEIKKMTLEQGLRIAGYNVVALSEMTEELINNYTPRMILASIPNVDFINQIRAIWPKAKILIAGEQPDIPEMSNVEFLEGEFGLARLICKTKLMLFN